MIDKNKKIVESRWVAWLVNNGHVPRYDDHKLKDKVLKLIKWVPGDLYMQTSAWRKYELNGYVGERIYCSLKGENFEYDPYAYEATHRNLLTPWK